MKVDLVNEKMIIGNQVKNNLVALRVNQNQKMQKNIARDKLLN